jgi:hypothetical protein
MHQDVAATIDNLLNKCIKKAPKATELRDRRPFRRLRRAKYSIYSVVVNGKPFGWLLPQAQESRDRRAYDQETVCETAWFFWHTNKNSCESEMSTCH